MIVWFFGLILSMIWGNSIGDYCQMLSEKYRVLLELEAEIKFPFFEKELGQTKDMPYIRISRFEIWIPVGFISVFFLLLLGNVVVMILNE